MDDIKPPMPQNPSPNSTDPISPAATNIPVTQPAETPQPYIAEPVSQPVAEAPSYATEQPAVDNYAPSAANAVKPKRSAMPLIVLLTVLVVLGLAAAAYFAIFKKDKPVETKPATTTETTTETTQPTVDAQSVSDRIDASLSKLDDTKDYATANLSDATLGF